jgi:hypothetical protein
MAGRGKPRLEPQAFHEALDVRQLGMISGCKIKAVYHYAVWLEDILLNQIIQAFFQARAIKGTDLKGHNHPVLAHHINQLVRLSNRAFLEDDLKDVVVPELGFIQARQC